jgi:hypothetical protein
MNRAFCGDLQTVRWCICVVPSASSAVCRRAGAPPGAGSAGDPVHDTRAGGRRYTGAARQEPRPPVVARASRPCGSTRPTTAAARREPRPPRGGGGRTRQRIVPTNGSSLVPTAKRRQVAPLQKRSGRASPDLGVGVNFRPYQPRQSRGGRRDSQTAVCRRGTSGRPLGELDRRYRNGGRGSRRYTGAARQEPRPPVVARAGRTR